MTPIHTPIKYRRYCAVPCWECLPIRCLPTSITCLDTQNTYLVGTRDLFRTAACSSAGHFAAGCAVK